MKKKLLKLCGTFSFLVVCIEIILLSNIPSLITICYSSGKIMALSEFSLTLIYYFLIILLISFLALFTCVSYELRALKKGDV